MPACAPTVADDRYRTFKTGTQASLNSTIVVAHELERNKRKIELIEENGCVKIREMVTKTRTEHRVVQKLVGIWDARRFVPVDFLAAQTSVQR
jgi:hypothetical protein